MTSSALLQRSHPARHTLNNEVHARPYEQLTPPECISYLALLTDAATQEADFAHLTALCALTQQAAPMSGANHFQLNCGTFRLKWERHTEFVTYTFIHDAAPRRAALLEAPFTETALQHVPAAWLEQLPGQLLVGVHLTLTDDPHAQPFTPEQLAAWFDPNTVVGSAIRGQDAYAYTDFRIHADGFSRMLVSSMGLSARRAGRIVQRLLEIETYRMMALLTLPVARDTGAQLASAEQELTLLTKGLGQAPKEEEPALLDRLTRLAGELESLHAATHFRFSAANAYQDLVQRRIAELAEAPLAGLQTIREFMERRLAPAMNTCAWAARRQHALGERISHASNLLQTRVEIERAQQSQELLADMDKRQKLQLRLQETVEGLSVAAISYYVVSLIGYVGKGLKALDVHVNPDLLMGLSIPVVLLGVALGVRYIRKHVEGSMGGH